MVSFSSALSVIFLGFQNICGLPLVWMNPSIVVCANSHFSNSRILTILASNALMVAFFISLSANRFCLSFFWFSFSCLACSSIFFSTCAFLSSLFCKTIASCLNFCNVPNNDPNILLFLAFDSSSPLWAFKTSCFVGKSLITCDDSRGFLTKLVSSSASLSPVGLADNLYYVQLINKRNTNIIHILIITCLLKTVLVSCGLFFPNLSSLKFL